MSDSMKLQDISKVIESIFCGFDIEAKNEFTDKAALQLLEAFFDKYHFKDTDLSISDSTINSQFEIMLQAIEQDLPDTSEEQLIKVMATIYRSIQRRTNGGREYLSFVQQYVGARVAPGARVLRL